MVNTKDVDDILKKYKGKFKSSQELYKAADNFEENPDFSNEYNLFKKELLGKRTSLYEGLCNSFGKILQVKPGKKDEKEIQNSIDMAHLNVTPGTATGFAVFVVFIGMLFGIVLGGFGFLVSGSLFFPFIGVLLVLFFILSLKPLSRIPIYLAARWRLKASNQMVLCILYMVIYMRHTSNLENALRFAAIHIKAPLSLDLRKVLWDVETEKYSTLNESLDDYLLKWRDYNLEFVNSVHLIESSLYEGRDEKRLDLLDRSLENILRGTYERMLYYAHGLKSPITMLHMLGIVLPILGLVILPMISSFIQGIPLIVKLGGMILVYNLLLPLAVFSFGVSLLSKRPTGYGEGEFVLERRVGVFLPFLVILLFSSVAFVPVLLHYVDPGFDMEFGILGGFLQYVDGKGPYGTVALLFSLLVPLGLGLGLGLYFSLKSRKLIDQQNEIKNLEKEFSSSLFQLGNRIGEGIPAELAFGKVAETMKGTPSGDFFGKTHANIHKLGMSIKNAIFNNKNGALLYYPSPLIQSSMEVLVESSKKGNQIVASSLISISNYASRIREINERLRDLMADIVADMHSQVSFLAPVIAGVVVGIASMIVNIFLQLGNLSRDVGAEGGDFGSQLDVLSNFLDVSGAVPTFYFQIVVGVFIVQVVYILTVMANGIENGADKLSEQNSLARNLFRSTLLYVIVAFLTILVFNIIAVSLLGGLSGIAIT